MLVVPPQHEDYAWSAAENARPFSFLQLGRVLMETPRSLGCPVDFFMGKTESASFDLKGEPAPPKKKIRRKKTGTTGPLGSPLALKPIDPRKPSTRRLHPGGQCRCCPPWIQQSIGHPAAWPPRAAEPIFSANTGLSSLQSPTRRFNL